MDNAIIFWGTIPRNPIIGSVLKRKVSPQQSNDFNWTSFSPHEILQLENSENFLAEFRWRKFPGEKDDFSVSNQWTRKMFTTC